MAKNFSTTEITELVPRVAVADVIANKAFRHLWFGQISSQLAIAMTMFVLALRVYQLTGSSTAVSGLYLTFGIPAAALGLVAGAIVDHFDKRMVLMFCDFFRTILVLGLLFLSHNIAVVYVLAFLNAVVTQFYVPAEAPSIPRLVPASQLVMANSLFSFTFYSSLAVGAVMAGPVLLWLGPYWVFLFIGLLFLFAGWNAYYVPREVGKREIPTFTQLTSFGYVAGQVTKSMQEGLHYISRSRVLVDALLLLTGTQVILALLATLGPGFADRLLEIDIHDASVILVGPAVLGIVLGALWVGNFGFRLGAKKLINTGIVAAGIILILVALTVRLRRIEGFDWLFANQVIIPIELCLFFLLGVANSFLDVPANSILQHEAEGPMRSRVYGLLTAVIGGIGIFPVVVSGILADVIGVGKVIFILGLLITAYGFYRTKYTKSFQGI